MAKKPAKAKAKPAKKKAAKPAKKAPKPAKKAAKPAKEAKPTKAAKPAKQGAKPVAKVAAKSAAKAPAKPAKPSATKAPAKAKPPTSTSASESTSAASASTTAASEPATTITSASKAAGNAGATTNTGPAWKASLRDELAALPDDFTAYCAERGASAEGAWEIADSDALRGLEAWGKELADRDRALGVAALVSIAQVGFPRAMASAGKAADNMGFHASEGSMDGAPVEAQIERGAAWLADPSDENFDQVVAALDPSRQLNVWDEDLLPQRDEDNWFWYSEVGQCISHAISGEGGEAEGASYYEWTPAMSVGRGLVMAVRGLRAGDNETTVLGDLRAGMI